MTVQSETLIDDRILFEYADELLDDEKSIEIERLLGDSEFSRRRLNQFSKSLEVVRDAFVSPPPVSIPSIESIEQRRQRILFRQFTTAPIAALAATCLILLAVWPAISWNNTQQDTASTPAVTDMSVLKNRIANLQIQMRSLKTTVALQHAELAATAKPDTSFKEGTAAILMAAAKHREESMNDTTGAVTRYREVLEYYPETNAAIQARERIDALNT